MIDNKTPPDLVLDSTRSGVISKVVKMMTKKLGLPTLSMSYGQMDDIIGQYPISYHIDHISNTVNSLNNWQDFWNLNLMRIKEITDDNFCIYQHFEFFKKKIGNKFNMTHPKKAWP